MNRQLRQSSSVTPIAPRVSVPTKQAKAALAKRKQKSIKMKALSSQAPPAPQVTPERISEEKEARDALRKQVLKKNMGKYSNLLSKTEQNLYLKTIVDPERYTGVRYPDDFGRKTAVVNSILNHDCYVFPTDNQVEPAGTYLNVLTPSLTEPLLEYTMESLGGITTSYRVRGLLNKQDLNYGLTPIDETRSAICTDSGMFVLSAGSWNVKAPWFTDAAGVTSNAFTLFRGENGGLGIFYGFPVMMDLDDGAMTITLVADVPFTATGLSTTVFAEIVSEFGALQAAFNTTAGSPVATVTITASGIGTNFDNVLTISPNGLFRVAGLPGMGVRLINLGSAISLSSVSWSLAPATLTAIPTFAVVNLPDVDTYLQKVDQYRVISSSVWLEYQGADLTNGGQAAAIMFRGGRPYSYNGLWEFDKVAETPGGYQGALKIGSYSFWIPASISDTLMRQINNFDRWDSPYIVNVGLVASPDLPHVLRMRVPMNFELMSTAQFFTYACSEVHPDWIRATALVTRDIPTSMENPQHLAFIDGLIDKGLNAIGGLAKGIFGGLF